MLYRLGWYDENAQLKCLMTAKTKEDALFWYKKFKEKYHCTIWVQKIEFVDPKKEFEL